MSDFKHINVGELRERVSLLALTGTGGSWAWAERGKLWAKAEKKTGRNLFSTVGLGGRGLSLTVRRRELTLHNALLWRGQHCFLTDIRDNGRLYLDVDAALVTPVACVYRGMSFPAVRTEKYTAWRQEAPMSVNLLTFVLVVPKAVPELTPGELVTVAGEAWEVRVPHTLDEYKNEYEVGRTVEL
ncbi:MAG: hypothetical protein ACLSE7_00885 [Lachnospirales bacterium]